MSSVPHFRRRLQGTLLCSHRMLPSADWKLPEGMAIRTRSTPQPLAHGPVPAGREGGWQSSGHGLYDLPMRAVGGAWLGAGRGSPRTR